jgi:predicted ATPase
MSAPELRAAAAVASGRRRFDSPLVGREPELAVLRDAFARVAQRRRCDLLTVIGAAGIGKSRLVQEFADELGERATVLHGHCLPYGEGITYWPLTQVVREILRAGGSDSASSAAAIAALLPGDERAGLIAELIVNALGLGSSGVGTGDAMSWAVRRLFEALAQRRPLVLVLDDLQWAEPTFLDLVGGLAELSRDAPILLLGVARPELLETYPGWGAARLNAETLALEPLADSDCGTLIANLLGHGPLPADAAARVTDAAEGNALFAEELVAMLVDDGLLAWDGARWSAAGELLTRAVPTTFGTLLDARLEGLPSDERALLALASVEGTQFHRSAIGALAPDAAESFIERSLAALVERDVIRPDRASFEGDEAYRFRHLLIRDAAYRSLAQAQRADNHERLADWIERMAAGRMGEFEEIVGYHLEQAYRCRLELRSADDRLKALGARASHPLEQAGRRALSRGDLPAAIGMLERACDLAVGDVARRAELLPELGAALIAAGRLSEADWVLDEARLVASQTGDERLASRVLVQLHFLRLLHVTEGGIEAAASAVQQVLPVFERAGDQQGLSGARRLEAWLHWNEAQAAAAAEAWEQAAAHASLASDETARAEILTWIASSLWFGPTTIADGIRRCEEIRAEVGDHLDAEALTLRHLAGLHAMNGDVELARSLLATSNAVFDDLGLTLNAATSHNEGLIEMLAGDFPAAEASLRTGFDALTEMGEQAFLSTTAAFLARAVFEQGRLDEAEALAQQSEQLADAEDLLTQVLWRGVQARVLAERGQLGTAEVLAREAVALAEQTDFVVYRGDALIDLAHVLRASHRTEDASAAAAAGLALHDQKGNLVTAGKIRSDLGDLL